MQPVSPTTTTHKKTNADYARDRRELREQHRKELRCVDCGATPLALKLDGSPSLRCEKHLDRTRYINEKRSENSRIEDVLSESDMGGHFDDPEFHTYTNVVADAVVLICAQLIIDAVVEAEAKGEDLAELSIFSSSQDLRFGVTTRMIHEFLGDKARLYWTADALWMAKVANLVRSSDTLPTRWYPVSQPTTDTGATFNQADAECPPADTKAMRAAA